MGGDILLSSDGETWTPKTSGPFDRQNPIQDIAYGKGTFVIVGQAVAFHGGSTEWLDAVLVSTDGMAWTLFTLSLPCNFRRITFVNGAFLALTDSGTILASSDGITWVEKVSGLPEIRAVAYGKGLYVAVGEAILTSPDGEVWTVRVSGTVLNQVVYGNGTFVAVGDWGTILTSTDGVTWTKRVSGSSTNFFYGVTYGHGTFVAVGFGDSIYSGLILTSSDGAGWTERIRGKTPALRAIAYGSGSFVAIGDSGAMLASSDGESWVLKDPETIYPLGSLVYGKGSFVVTGYRTTILQSDKLVTCL